MILTKILNDDINKSVVNQNFFVKIKYIKYCTWIDKNKLIKAIRCSHWYLEAVLVEWTIINIWKLFYISLVLNAWYLKILLIWFLN